MNTPTARTGAAASEAFQPSQPALWRRVVDVVLRRYASVALLLILIIAFSVLSPQFLTRRNWQNLLVVQSVVTCMSLAATMPLVVAEFDLSLGSMIGLLAMLGAYLGGQHFTAETIIPAMLIAGLVAGAINGLLTVKLHISSFIATLGTGIVLSGVTLGISNGQVLFTGIPKIILTIGQGRWLGLGISVWLTLLLASIMFVVLEHTPFGRRLYASGGRSGWRSSQESRQGE